ncbi:DUF3079 domain-containing protein [Pseudomonas muyukensis]|uniref:DUF3079 domain-containing protein n=1 Tax=Pseudomonas muyukensis TaxID=2842357 RepID=UPI001CED2EA4|nr:DUF3079 domain-containing protein [Pseudomonas muyukensis]
MAKKFPSNPSHPERICWGCDLYCPAKALACGNGAERTMHPVELFGEDWDQLDARLDQPIAPAQDLPANSPQNAVLTVNARLRGSP